MADDLYAPIVFDPVALSCQTISMDRSSRARAGIFSLTLAFAAIAFAACQGKKEPAKPDLEESKKLTKQSLEELKTLVARQSQDLSGVHGRFDTLPEDMPGLPEVRSKLFAVEEVLGVDGGRIKWLSNKLEAAIAAGTTQQLNEVAVLIQDAIKGNHAKVVVELDHEVMRFERKVFRHKLPTGFEIKAAHEGLEERLVAYLEDSAKKVDKATWFDFDRLSFFIGDTKPDLNESKSQLEGVVAILKAYPQAKLKIGVFTDNVAPAVVSKKLSSARAQAVKDALITLGAEASRLSAQGYGPQYPECPANDTPECQRMNRRVAAQVIAK